MDLRLAVIGTGVMGSDHARTVRRHVDGATVVTIADPDTVRARALARELGCQVSPGTLAVVEDPGVDAVIVASPDPTHEDVVLACLAAGKPVLCEKPLASTAAACLRLVRAEASAIAEHGHPLVQVGFMRRYDPGYLAMKAALDGGQIGTPLLVHCVHRNTASTPSFTSDMLFASSATHEIDIVRWLLDEEIVEVRAIDGRRSSAAPPGLRDPRMLVLRTSSGVLINVEIFVNAGCGYQVGCQVVGERGTLDLVPAAPTTDWRDRFAAAYQAQLRDWVHHARHGTAGGPGVRDGYAATVTALAAVESASSGHEVTLAPLPAAEFPAGHGARR